MRHYGIEVQLSVYDDSPETLKKAHNLAHAHGGRPPCHPPSARWRGADWPARDSRVDGARVGGASCPRTWARSFASPHQAFFFP